MYMIYSGAYTVMPKNVDNIVYIDEGDNYIDGLKKIGYNIDKILYTRGCMVDGITHLDFGSWSLFACIGNEDQLGKYVKMEEERG